MGGGAKAPCVPAGLGSTRQANNSDLWGIVDMGSNGIRFSISSLSPSTARVLPTLYSYRNGTSLYEAQYDDDGNQIPIPEDVQESVIGAFLRFQIFCSDFGVPFKNIRIIATEATRKAINGEEFVEGVARETGLKVEVLSQADEGETGAWGIASSSNEVRGLVMDLGGGSTQITWMTTKDGHMQTSPKGAFSFPYGAAALTQRLTLIEKNSTSKEEEDAKKEVLRQEMKQNFLNAYNGLEVPAELVRKAQEEDGFTLYLSGGGFRGWGYLLLYQAQKHEASYPISIINGFVARKKDFTDTNELKKVAKRAKRIFRVSDRRRAQVPAVAFLVNVLAEIIPHGIKEAHFCQGGVREGVLFSSLPPEIRMESPMETATEPFARPLAPKLAKLLRNALPKNEKPRLTGIDANDIDDGWGEIPPLELLREVPSSFTKHIVQAMANMLYVHSEMSKELSSAAALYTTSTGYLADTHGTSHKNRALLALLLEARYEGDLPPREYSFREALRRLLSPAELWWINYLGAVALVLSQVYPAGGEDDMEAFEDDVEDEDRSISSGPEARLTIPQDATRLRRPHHKKPHLKLRARFADDLGSSGDKPGLRLVFILRTRKHNKDDPMKVQEALEDSVKKIIKVGKKKHWIRTATNEDAFESDSSDQDTAEDDGDDLGWGMKVDVDIEVEHPE
ncbi:retrograde regulation protein 2 [Knufia obscura]|uniref:Retrograde regulation protein 2 n=1 Tax=Knufia obscura TaxID=1635080 RepID=A0ABR0RFX8_9EURO|nr:retrograde regulation protein 2 [Knufia obscura]